MPKVIEEVYRIQNDFFSVNVMFRNDICVECNNLIREWAYGRDKITVASRVAERRLKFIPVERHEYDE